jgi:hypothetical protein
MKPSPDVFFAQNDAVTSFHSLIALDRIKAAGSDLAIPDYGGCH